jgi:hypothetical protein
MPPQDFRQNQSADMRMRITVDGVTYPFDLTTVTANIELELWRQAGLKLTQIVAEVAEAPAGFHVAALVFLARRAQGDQITFDDVASHMGLASELNIEVVEDDTPGDDDSPEALAAG